MSVVSNHVYDAREAGFSIFGIYGADKNGNCECCNPECEALFKHPRVQSWNLVQPLSDEQFDVMVEAGYLSSGYGVLVKGLLVVDVDARNGGLESYKQLCIDLGIDLLDVCRYVVNTGSGGGSMHLYFKSPSPPMALIQIHPNYKGIDFKTTGYVVGAGSKHKSGTPYEVEKGYPQDIAEAPISLVKLLEKRQHYRAKSENGTIDIKLEELQNVVLSISNDDGSHDKWLSVGMGIHDTTNGDDEGLDLWIKWSEDKPNFNADEMRYRWHTLGKSSNVITFGTLLHYAKQDGYSAPVTFDASGYFKEEENEDILDTSHIDIRKPHGFIGTLTQWINDQCRYPRENLAVAAALYIVSCLGGMRAVDEEYAADANLICFSVAGSGTGKEAIYSAVLDCFKAAGVMPAVHGKFKSEQEAMRNLLRHQASFYAIDEMGIELSKVSNAAKRGSTPYMEGLIGFIMSAFTKANGTLPVSGDLKEDIKDKIKAELQRIYKKMDAEGEEKYKPAESRLLEQLRAADNGIINPYLGMFGTTTPSTFYGVIDEDTATNGFIARAVIFKEKEDNPRMKKGFKKQPMDMQLQIALSMMYSGGESGDTEPRIERKGEKNMVTTTEDANDALNAIHEYFYNLAEQQKHTKGLTAIPRRGFELVLKISLVMALCTGVRTLQDVLYAFHLVKDDINFKIELANANRDSNNSDEAGSILLSAIITKLDKDTPITLGQLRNRNRKFTKEQIDKAIGHLKEKGEIEIIDGYNEKNRTKVKYIKLAN